MKHVVVGLVLVLVALVAIGCGGGPAGSASGEASDETSGAEVVEETGDVVDATAASVGEAEMEDQNQQIADTYAKVAPKELAELCASPLPQESQERIMAKILGPQIIKQGGDVEEVLDLLFERC